jgi:hypothetical protein
VRAVRDVCSPFLRALCLRSLRGRLAQAVEMEAEAVRKIRNSSEKPPMSNSLLTTCDDLRQLICQAAWFADTWMTSMPFSNLTAFETPPGL